MLRVAYPIALDAAHILESFHSAFVREKTIVWPQPKPSYVNNVQRVTYCLKCQKPSGESSSEITRFMTFL